MSRTEYAEFIRQKIKFNDASGTDPRGPLNEHLFDFQRDIVTWSLRKGRAAIFADCGLGKTLMQLEWARHVSSHGSVLILTPLAVAEQTVREGRKFGIDLSYARRQEDATSAITVTNYEMLERFAPDEFAGVVIDESSILKAYDGKTRTQIIESFSATPYRLACTATPAPNDFIELGNHSEFLGRMTRAEMLSMFFVHDGGETQSWRLKGHAEGDFWRWVASWAVTVRKPSDLGGEDEGFTLPPIEFVSHVVRAKGATNGCLFPMMASSLQERLHARRETTEERSAKAAEIVRGDQSSDQWLVWCNLNNEADAFRKHCPDAVEIRGSDAPEIKKERMLAFGEGKIRVLITKPSIAGFGMNWQNCRNMIFLGLSDSFEEMYQATRRCWRFGQERDVRVHVVTADTEGAVVRNIQRKEEDHKRMAEEMVSCMKDEMIAEVHGQGSKRSTYKETTVEGKSWTMHLGDCVEAVRSFPDNSIDFSVFSPPFASLYTYSDSERDMGNCQDDETFMTHFGFLIDELYRVISPGRLVSFHCMNLPTSKARDGVIGIRDFRGDLIRAFTERGFIYHSEVCIWKDPVTAMQRTKALGLLHKQLKKDSCMSRQGIPDYLVTMRKPGENQKPVSNTNETFPVDLWQRYASPVWMDINPSDTLQYQSARDHKDEKHICPLQLDVIARALKLWSNPGDLVLSPFGGIGSEGYQAVKMGRRFVGVELKESYFRQACANLKAAETANLDLFSVETAA